MSPKYPKLGQDHCLILRILPSTIPPEMLTSSKNRHKPHSSVYAVFPPTFMQFVV